MSVRKSETGAKTITRQPTRLPYQKPGIIDYGSVASLTQKAGSLADGAHGSRGCDPRRGW